MSQHRENVVWETREGTWSIGFYKVIKPSDPGPDFDDEWDVDYDFSEFSWVSTGHPSAEAAQSSWPGANPGSFYVIRYKGNSSQVKAFNQLVLWHRKPELKVAFEKKQNRALNRAHFKKLQEQFEAANRYAHNRVRVEIKASDDPHSLWGVTSSVTGYLRQDGDWLKVEGARVFNTKHNRFAPRIRSIAPVGTSRWR